MLFLDADIEMAHSSVIRRAVELAQEKELHCVTTNIVCRDGGWFDKAMYAGNDLFQYLSRLHKPFATGMFMLFDRRKFQELGGFHEQATFGEDYLLSQQVARRRFGIVRGGVYTTNRRFQRMGHLRVARLFLRTAFNFWNEKFFLRDAKDLCIRCSQRAKEESHAVALSSPTLPPPNTCDPAEKTSRSRS